MDIRIFDEQRCLRIVCDDVAMLLNKQQIRVIDTPNKEQVRIDIGEGPLRHIFIRASEVSVPSDAGSADDLRDILAGWWQQDYSREITYGNQVDQLKDLNAMVLLLTDIKDILGKNNGTAPASNVLDRALITDNYVAAGIIYFGYSEMTSSVQEATWAIKKTITTNGKTVELWAGGNQYLTHVWNNRVGLTYMVLPGS